MPINKKALTRYLAYDRCFRNRGRKYTWKDLVEEANTSLREEGLEGIGKTQFYADMQSMEFSWKAPIEKHKNGRTVYYRYSDSNYSISNQPLSETESTQLKSAILVLSRFKGMPQFGWVNEIIPALETKLGLINTEKEVICFESNLDYEGLIYITPLFNAIVNKRVLKISYQDFKSPIPYDIEFHPYYLKQYNSRWFAFGYNTVTKSPYWVMALDRIKTIEELKSKYTFIEIDWDDYFFDIIGVTKLANEEPIEIKLLFALEQAPYIVTKPLHPSQKHKNDENGLEVSLKLIPNYEFEKLILSFGETVKILSPKSFQKKISEKLKTAYTQYRF